MSESIVQKQPAVLTNPFAKHAPDHLNAGAVAIESERAIAEAQGKLVIAKRFPRDEARAYSAIIDACKRPGLAEEACYSFPRGGEVVSGPAIRLAEMLAANWGNVDYGIRELSRKEGVSEMEAYCWDLQTNTMSSQKFTVRHIRDTRGGGKALTDERDIYELTANMGARRLRARILAILPADLVQAAVDQCSRTLASGGDAPIQDRIRKMVTAFKSLGVPAGLIEKRLGHALDVTTGEELADLTKIHNSLRDNMSSLGDWFGDGSKKDEPAENMPGDPVVERAPVPERKKRGVRAVEESVGQPGSLTNPEPAKTAPVSNAAGMAIVDPEKNAAYSARLAEQAAQTARESEAQSPVESFQQAAAATEEAPAEPAKATPPTKPESRAFLNDKEEIETEVTVAELNPLNITQAGVVNPSVKAKLKGGFVGEVYHIGGGIAEGEAVKPKQPWAVGATLKVKLLGKINAKAGGKIQVFVQAVSAVTETEEF